MKNATKQELARGLKDLGYKHHDSVSIINHFFDSMAKFLINGDKIFLRGFGTMYARTRKVVNARNPKTNQPIEPKEVASVKMIFSKHIKRSLDEPR